jgi:DHA1 family inner membrane transport protein
MAFFRNDAVNRVNLHYAIQSLAVGAGGVFFLAYLLHAGVAVPAALATMAAIFAARFALRPLVIPLGKRWGLKPLVIAGALLMAAQYPLLAEVSGFNAWLVVIIAVGAIADVVYWPSYHAYFASLGDAEHRGHQIGAREALAALAGIVAPLVGGWALVSVGPRWLFWSVALVQALSALPLLGAPNVRPPAQAPEVYKAARVGLPIFISDGWQIACSYSVWQVVLFGSLGRSLAAFGGTVALAALVGAVGGLVLGRYVDLGHGRRATMIAYGAAVAVVLLRAASVDSLWLAVLANTLGALVGALTVPAMMAAVYNLAKSSPDTFRFHVVSEGGWDIGCGSGLVVAAILAACGVSLAFAILLAVPACAATAWLLWRYYGAHPEAALAPPAVLVDLPFRIESEPPV